MILAAEDITHKASCTLFCLSSFFDSKKTAKLSEKPLGSSKESPYPSRVPATRKLAK